MAHLLPPKISGTSVCLQDTHCIGVAAALDVDPRGFFAGTFSPIEAVVLVDDIAFFSA